MAIAAQRKGDERKIVAVIGDGAMTAGMAFEALNHGGDVEPDMLVILNDNGMSISENVGATDQDAGAPDGQPHAQRAARARQESDAASELVACGASSSAGRNTPRACSCPATLFEELGFHYTGPIDGHDIAALLQTLKHGEEPQGPAAAARHHHQGQGLRAGRSRRRSNTTRSARSTRSTAWSRKPRRGEADLHRRLRRLAVRHGRGR